LVRVETTLPYGARSRSNVPAPALDGYPTAWGFLAPSINPYLPSKPIPNC
jgi:hypothetical protein